MCPEGGLLMDHLHWQTLGDNNGNSDNHYLFALATLGDMTQIGLFLFMSLRPRWPRQVLFHVTGVGDNDSIIA
jgi:hypothetical protein